MYRLAMSQTSNGKIIQGNPGVIQFWNAVGTTARTMADFGMANEIRDGVTP